jgi:hypothetical protein
MTFDSTERSVLAALADLLIPPATGFPSASEAGVSGEGLDRILAVRPDLAGPLKHLLQQAQGHVSAEFLQALQADDPAGFGVLAEVVPGAYFMHPEVRSALGYDGQTARPIDPRPDHLDDGLLQSVIDRGPIYRPPPGPERR